MDMKKFMNKLFAAGNILGGFLVVVMSMLSFVACSENEGETLIDNNVSSMSLAVNIDGWGDTGSTRASYSAMSEGSSGNKVFGLSFTSGDAIGLFACDKDGKVVIANHKWSYNGSACATESPIEYVTGMSGYTFFAYYPWKSSLSGAPALNSTPDISSAEAFFGSAISAWTPAADQSTIAAFTGSDLMVAKGTTSTPYFHEVQVAFTMAHQMGLAVTQPDLTFYDINDPSYTWTVTQSFTGNIPYQIGSNYYYLVKPGVETTIGAKSTTLAARQVEQLFFTNMEPGEVERSGNTMTLHSGKIKLGNSVTYTYSTNGGSSFSSTKPSWLSVPTIVSGAGEPTVISVTPDNTKTTNTVVGDPITVLASEALSGKPTVSNVDLSMVDNAGNPRATRTTANCYLVHNPGTYRIPLVYGNAIKNGENNSLAYHATASGSNIKSDLVNHADAAITDPWLKNNSATPDGAELLWQDVNGMITAVGIDGDYLTFTVAGTAAGNAVIAAKMGSVIVWSWHIWVTDETLSATTAVNASTHTYNVAPVNVGWVSNKLTTIYQGSSCIVRATNNGVALKFTVQQPNYVTSAYSNGRNPYYQGGRKDPEIPMNLFTNYNCNTYDISGNAVTTSSGNTITTVSGAYSIGTTIQNPQKHYYNSSNYGPYKENRYNYWDINQNSTSAITTATVKTVYDPCPPEFCVPTGQLYNWMAEKTSTWTSTSNQQGRMLTYNSYNIFFPASGGRNNSNSELYDGGSFGYCWSASAGSSYDARFMKINLRYFLWDSTNRAFGFSVRPVAEE